MCVCVCVCVCDAVYTYIHIRVPSIKVLKAFVTEVLTRTEMIPTGSVPIMCTPA